MSSSWNRPDGAPGKMRIAFVIITVIVLGLGALVVLAAFAPWVHDHIRVEVLIRRIESGEDPEARRELACLRYAGRVRQRLLDALKTGGNPGLAQRLAAPLVDLACEKSLPQAVRRDLFDSFFPARFEEGSTTAVPRALSEFYPRDAQLYVLRANGMLSEFVRAEGWLTASYPVHELKTGSVAQYMEYFVQGKGADTKLVFLRSSWVVFPPGASTISGRFRVEREDLTDLPDPFNFYLARPKTRILPGGKRALELRMAIMGVWRQFVPGLRLLERSVSYDVLIDRTRSRAADLGPFLLGSVGVHMSSADGRWVAEDAVLKKPIEVFASAPHWVSFHLPASALVLEPLERVRLLFRAAPAFGRKNGFSAPATDSPPFDREYYLPPEEE